MVGSVIKKAVSQAAGCIDFYQFRAHITTYNDLSLLL